MRWMGALIALGCLVALALPVGSSEQAAIPQADNDEVDRASVPIVLEKASAPTLAMRSRPTDDVRPQALLYHPAN